MSSRELTFAEALQEAAFQEMTRDSSIFVMGMGADDFKAIYGTTKNLPNIFAAERVFDTPLSEDAMTGFMIGAALSGLKPVHIHIRMDFLMLAMNQLVNIAAKMRFMYGGKFKLPIVVRAIIGKSWGQGAQHSQALHSMLMHVPGLKVLAPTDAYEAKGCLITAIRDEDPVILIEHMLLHKQRSAVPEEAYALPLGLTRQKTKGKDLTLVGISWASIECLRAEKILAEEGISCDVLTVVSLSPLNIAPILESLKITGRLLVVDNAWLQCGASAEILARCSESYSGSKQVLMRRLGFAPVSCPTAPNLEAEFYPTAEKIAQTVYEMIYPKRGLKFISSKPSEAAAF